MAQPRSLGYRTDFMLTRFDGTVEDRGDHWTVKTPSNPDFTWGNCLVFKQPPRAGDADAWEAAYERELGEAGHHLMGWDCPDGAVGEIDQFVERGYALDQGVVLASGRVVPPPRPNTDLRVRVVETDDEWRATQATLKAAFGEQRGYETESQMRFVERQVARYRAMTRAGLGAWFGGWIGDELAGSLGIFHEGELGRFQLVGVDPKFRKRGVCGSLVYGAARMAFAEMRVRTLVICADATYHAWRVYASVGLAVTERLMAVRRLQTRS